MRLHAACVDATTRGAACGGLERRALAAEAAARAWQLRAAPPRACALFMSSSFSPVAYSMAWLAPWLLGCVMRAEYLFRPVAPAAPAWGVWPACAVTRTRGKTARRAAPRRGAQRSGAVAAPGSAISGVMALGGSAFVVL